MGQTWDGKTCVGEAKKFTFDQAQNQAAGGWRVPTIRELVSLMYCSSGQSNDRFDPQDGGPAVAHLCSGRSYSRPAINTTAFPETPGDWYWTSSRYKGYSSGVWFIVSSTAGITFSGGTSFVRFVRASQLSGSEAALEFPISIDEIIRIAESRRQEEQRIAEAKRQEEERRVKAQRAAAERSLVAGGAQELYLKAGRAQRSGSVAVGGVNFYATELYEMIVDKFPKSEYAVKASDQLNAMDRTETQARAVRDAANRAAEAQREADRNASNRAACFSQVNSCTASCRNSPVDSSSSYLLQKCINGCQRTCN